MEPKDDVFPYVNATVHTGICMRDYIAIQAMNGILSSGLFGATNTELIASRAYELADAMIKESKNNG